MWQRRFGEGKSITKSTKNRCWRARGGTQNRSKMALKTLPGHPWSTLGLPEFTGLSPGRSLRAPRAAKRPSLGLPGRPKIAHRDHREPPRSKKNAHVKRFCSKKVALPFSDCFFIDFRLFLGGADPCFVWPGPLESHFSNFRKSHKKNY